MSDEPIKFSFVESGLDAIKNNLNSVKGVIAGIATIATFKKMINEATEADDNLRKLSFAMQGAQTYSEKAVESFNDFAAQMQKTTRFSDDATISLATLFRNITSLSNNQIKSAIDRTADLATVLGVDLETAGRKVINVLEGNTSALSRYGIKVKDGSNEQERLNNLLEATSKLTGSANNDLSTYSGTLAFVNNNLNDVFESLGKVITRNASFQKGLIATAEASKTFADFIGFAAESVDNLFSKETKSSLEVRLQNVTKELEKLEATPSLDIMAKIFGGPTKAQQIENFKLEMGAIKTLIGDIEKKEIEESIVAETVNKKKGIVIVDNTKLYDEQLKKILDVQNAVQNVGLTEIQVLEKTRNERLKAFKEGEDQLLIKGGATLEQVKQLELNIETDFQSKMSEIRKKADKEKLDSQTKEVVEANTFSRKKLLNASFNSAKQGSIEYAANEQRLSNLSDTFDTMASLTNSGNQDLFNIGKAAAISTATVDGIVGVQKALASAPPPFNAILAGIVGAATAANVIKIASTQFGGKGGNANTGTGATGTGAPAVTVSGNLGGLRPMATGGLVPQGFPMDNFPARLTSSELVLDVSVTKKLQKFLDEREKSEQTSKLNEIFNRSFTQSMTGKETENKVKDAVDKIKAIAGQYNTGSLGQLDLGKFSDIKKLSENLMVANNFNNKDTWNSATNATRDFFKGNIGSFYGDEKQTMQDSESGTYYEQNVSKFGLGKSTTDYATLNQLMQTIIDQGDPKKMTVITSDVKLNENTFAKINFSLKRNGARA